MKTMKPLLAGAATLLLVVSAGAGLFQSSEERKEAAKAARKIEKARSPKHEAKKEQEALDDFQKKLLKYVRVHENHLARLNAQKQVTAQALGEAIARDRAKAKQGDIFLPEVQPVLRSLIAAQLSGPDALDARRAVVEGNPATAEDSVPVVPRVNAVYPSGATRSTVPASVLLTLPVLPDCLHYRFVKRDLILIDSVAQIIVDFLPDAMPAPSVK